MRYEGKFLVWRNCNMQLDYHHFEADRPWQLVSIEDAGGKTVATFQNNAGYHTRSMTVRYCGPVEKGEA